MESDESGVRLWEKEARQEQEKFFKNLKKNGKDHPLKSPWEKVSKKKSDRRYSNLRTKIGYGFFGPPCKSENESLLGYDENQTFLVDSAIETIRRSKSDASRNVFLAFVMLLSRDEDGVRAILPILRFFNEIENKTEFVDREGKRYADWDDLLSFFKCSNRDYCYPENGAYRDEEENIRYLRKDPSAPIVMLGKKSFVVRDHPELLQPDEMEMTETDVFRICSSVAFFFNIFCDEEKLWEWIAEAMDSVLKEVKKNLDPEEKQYWKDNWKNSFKNPKTKGCAIKCFGEVNVQDFVRRIKQEQITSLIFREKGLVEINEEIRISPKRYLELPDQYSRMLCRLTSSADKEELRRFSKKKGLDLTFEFEKKENRGIIFQLFKGENLCRLDRNFGDFENIQINDIIIVLKDLKSHQLESLNRALNVTCKEGGEKLIRVGLRLMNMQKCRNVEDLYNAIEYAAAYIRKLVKERNTDYKTQSMEGNQKEVDRRFGIEHNGKPKKVFLQKEIETCDMNEMNASFNDSQSECLELCKKYDWRFHRNSAAAYHCLKHGETENFTEGEYFEKIQHVLEKSNSPDENKEIVRTEKTVQDGDAICKTVALDDRILIFYERKTTTPEAALESVIILATSYLNKKKRSKVLDELTDLNTIDI